MRLSPGWWVGITLSFWACTAAPGAHLGAVGTPSASELPRLTEVIGQLEEMSALQRNVDALMMVLPERTTDDESWREMRDPVIAASSTLRRDIDLALEAVGELQAISGGKAEFYAAFDVDSQLEL